MRSLWFNLVSICLVLGILIATAFIWRQTILVERAARIAQMARVEKTITIIPGWDLRDIAKYLIKQGFATSTDQVFAVTGAPLTTKNKEGYLAPETYRVYADASLDEVIKTLESQRTTEFTPELITAITNSKRTKQEILTMASILEKEVRTAEDKALVADIFWRRHDVGMGLQADSTVHYATGKEGDVFTTNKDRQFDNFWNTYKYPKLPPGPISNPSMESIRAAVYPKKNDYWYFLTTLDTGEVKYARTLAEQNANAVRFLKK
jgi:UPF0755 protein